MGSIFLKNWTTPSSTSLDPGGDSSALVSISEEDSHLNTNYIDIGDSVSVTNLRDTSHLNTSDSEIPSSFMIMSDLSSNCVVAYSILFVMAAVGNISVFYSVLKQMRHYKNRISLLILHLSVADLVVTFFAMPMEIVWRITIQWYGGDFLCKFCQFFRAFGLYLSSMVVICISLDRYFAIIYPLKLARAAERAKITLGVAWVFAVLCAAPQVMVFKVMPHPKYPSFRQCVTDTFLRSDVEQELVYNVFSVSILYFIPLLIIIFTYCRILCKIYRKSRKQEDKQEEESVSIGFTNGRKKSSVVVVEGELESSPTITTGLTRTDCQGILGVGNSDPDPTVEINEIGSYNVNSRRSFGIAPRNPTAQKFFLRKSLGGGVLMARARVRTLRLTCVIVLSFVFCWTPYVVMTLWYMIDREGAKSLDHRIQEGLLIMAVSNSVVNPLIYGTYGCSDCRRGSGSRYGQYYVAKGRYNRPSASKDPSPPSHLRRSRRCTNATANTVTSVVINHTGARCSLPGIGNGNKPSLI